MSDHSDDATFVLTMALKYGVIRESETKEMRVMISKYGLDSFTSLLRIREKQETDEEKVYRLMGTNKKAVDERLK